jgi:hypothetical protein
MIGGKATAYLCSGLGCFLPVTRPDELHNSILKSEKTG